MPSWGSASVGWGTCRRMEVGACGRQRDTATAPIVRGWPTRDRCYANYEWPWRLLSAHHIHSGVLKSFGRRHDRRPVHGTWLGGCGTRATGRGKWCLAGRNWMWTPAWSLNNGRTMRDLPTAVSRNKVEPMTAREATLPTVMRWCVIEIMRAMRPTAMRSRMNLIRVMTGQLPWGTLNSTAPA